MTTATVTPTILVSGSKGGVGKSTIAAGLSRAIKRQGFRVGLLDADLSGPSQGLLFECSDMEIVDGAIVPATSLEGIKISSVSLLSQKMGPLVWSETTSASAISTMIANTNWTGVDLLIVDLPPGVGQPAMQICEALPTAGSILVSTGSPLSLAECLRSGIFFRRLEVPVLALVQNMVSFKCDKCGANHKLFPDAGIETITDRLHPSLVLSVPFDPSSADGERLQQLATICISAAQHTHV
jgi:ATP-binding protein involved in chromosome partitioning